jgi:hypothetical protein
MRWHVKVIGNLMRACQTPNTLRAFFCHQSHLDWITIGGMNFYHHMCILIVGIPIDPYYMHD